MTQPLPLYQVDAFASRPFAGNPAAVVPLRDWLPDETLLNIAMENNLSETAFFVPAETGADHDFFLRWFTPKAEIALCGHATLASAAVIFRELGWDKDHIRFATRSAGPLEAYREGERVALDFPARPPVEVAMLEGLAEALGVPPIRLLHSKAGDMHMAVLEEELQLRSLKPDMDVIQTFGGTGLIVTAPGEDSDCASRFFAPQYGIPEDPVTGAAHCLIIPYWAEQLGRTEIYARQLSARGGDLYCHLNGDRVTMAGDAVFYLRGEIIWDLHA